MPNTLVIGTQWGDEGKGANIDRLSEQHDCIIRYQGGANAGHTVNIKGVEYILHLLPSGILRPDKVNIIGNGVLIDPIQVLDEINELKEKGINVTPDRLKISHIAPLIMQYNKVLDAASGGKIGTTGRAIGPTYADQADRISLRVCDLYLLSDQELKEKIEENLRLKNHILEFYNCPPVSLDDVMEPLLRSRNALEPFVHNDIKRIIHEHDGSLLAEGAQGTLLDICHGTYPFVTSSNSTKGGVYTGTGAGRITWDNIIGILKAYTTRVGEGPFPTELGGNDSAKWCSTHTREDEERKYTNVSMNSPDNFQKGVAIRRVGEEFGATTGRLRRIGWLDLNIGHYAVDVNGLNRIAITKLDVLTGLDKILVCTGYILDGKEANHFPIEQLQNCEPIYTELPGWTQDISTIRRFEDLPKEAQGYLSFIRDHLDTPIINAGVGPERKQMIKI